MLPRRVSELIGDPAHRGQLDGATCVGEAELGGIVRIGLWFDASGAIRRARFRATTCAALVAYAEAACALAEGEARARAPSAERIRAAVTGVHPAHHALADAVALAFTRALAKQPTAASPQERA